MRGGQGLVATRKHPACRRLQLDCRLVAYRREHSCECVVWLLDPSQISLYTSQLDKVRSAASEPLPAPTPRRLQPDARRLHRFHLTLRACQLARLSRRNATLPRPLSPQTVADAQRSVAAPATLQHHCAARLQLQFGSLALTTSCHSIKVGRPRGSVCSSGASLCCSAHRALLHTPPTRGRSCSNARRCTAHCHTAHRTTARPVPYLLSSRRREGCGGVQG